MAVAQVLALITLANSLPVLAKKIFGDRLTWPLDFGIELPDRHRLFGRSKTIRGVALAVICCWVGAPFLGVDPGLGAAAGLLAMAGDLLASFTKRRLNRPPSSQTLGLDQIPESLFPALGCVERLGLSMLDVAAIVLIFFAGEICLSRLLFRMRLRDEPY